jgi:hypothetical protein
MDNTKPYAGASDQRLTALINQDNNSALQLGVDFTFGSPQPYSDSTGRNTEVILTPVPGRPYAPTPEPVHYVRLALTVLDDLPVGWVKPVSIRSVPFSIRGILANINAALGLDLIADEVVDATYSVEADQYPLAVNEAVSLAWIDSDFQFKAVFGEVPLSSVVTNQELSGLNYVQPA